MGEGTDPLAVQLKSMYSPALIVPFVPPVVISKDSGFTEKHILKILEFAKLSIFSFMRTWHVHTYTEYKNNPLLRVL